VLVKNNAVVVDQVHTECAERMKITTLCCCERRTDVDPDVRVKELHPNLKRAENVNYTLPELQMFCE
jgi:hypothetical protein